MISPETKLTPKQFCDATHACENGVEYALTQPDMAAVWDNCPRVDWLLWIADKVGCMPDDKTLRLFAVWCVRETPLGDGRKVFDLLTDDRSKNSLLISEKYANCNATQRELAAARDAVWFSASAAARNAARAAARNAARAAAWDAASAAARNAARAAAWAAARDAVWFSESAAARDAARDAAWFSALAAARDAARDAALAAARDAAWDAARAAALAAARAAAWDAARAAVWDVARDAAWDAAWDAARAAAYTHQANHLRTLIKNPFKETNK